MLRAASDVLERDGPAQAGLSAIAREAGLSKGNLYRYFESREAILLHVLVQDYEVWVEEVVEALRPLAGTDDVGAVVKILVRELGRRPRLITLAPLVSSTLEHNVPADVIVWVKHSMAAATDPAVQELQAALPSLTLEGVGRFMAAFHHLVNGMAPTANPPLAVQDALESPELAGTSVDFETELEDLLVTIVYGLQQRFGAA